MKLPKLNAPSTAMSANLDTRQFMTASIDRQNKLILGLVLAVASMALALASLLPLKQDRVVVVESNSRTDEVSVPAQSSVQRFTPAEDNVMFFVRRWIKASFSIQPQLTVSSYQPLALSYLRGKNAIARFESMRANDKALARIASDPTLTREVEIESISPVAGADRGVVANLLLRTTTRGEIVEERRLLTLYYEFLPPKTDADRDLHPIGLYIVDFTLNDAR